MAGRAPIDVRGRGLAVAGLIGLLVAFAALLGPAAERSAAAQCKNSSLPGFKLSEREARKATLCLINRERSKRGMRGFDIHKAQNRAANDHNKAMIKKECFDHQCPGERDLVGRVEAAGYLPCKCSWSVAENIAWGKGGTSSPREIVNAWMNSSGHRANILNGKFEDIGIAVHDGAPGAGGGTATYTTDFGYKR